MNQTYSGLVGVNGEPLSSPIRRPSNHKKAPAPKLGEKYGPMWSGDRDRQILTMPGGGTVMFDLSKLTLADFRAMKDHYQINATLAVMTFMVHQMDWRVECEDKKIRDFVTENLKQIWTPFIRAVSQAFWSGYTPNILQWDNETDGRKVVLTKVKDVIPEEACVNWKDVQGWAPEGHIPPKIKVFDGIKVWGQNWPVPVENSFWYPLMMENGDMYGRKLLRPVFTSWYFSLLMHLFSNRYFERFGNPVPVGRASYEEEIDVNGTKVKGSALMVQALQNLRSGSVVVLPNDRSLVGNGTNTEYDYDIEYLESQMRGADFERYLMRLDEEMSIGLFTPLLILRTADVGSYNLGTTHWNMYLNMLNAIVGDLKSYADPYILDRMVDFNFGPKAARARLKFRKMGDDKIELVKALLTSMVGKGTVKPDLVELGDIAGLSLEEVEILVEDAGLPGGDPAVDKDGKGKEAGGKPASKPKSRGPAKTKSDNTLAERTQQIADGAEYVLGVIAPKVASQLRNHAAGGQAHATLDEVDKEVLIDCIIFGGIERADAVNVVDSLRMLVSWWGAETDESSENLDTEVKFALESGLAGLVERYV